MVNIAKRLETRMLLNRLLKEFSPDINGLSRWFSGKEPISQCRRLKRLRFDPWVGKIPWRIFYSSILAWRIPWTEEPGGLQPIGSQRVRHN